MVEFNDTWQTRPLVREGAPKRQDSNFEKKNLWSNVPDWLTDRQSQCDFDFDYIISCNTVPAIKCCTRPKWTIINVGGVLHIDTSPHICNVSYMPYIDSIIIIIYCEEWKLWNSISYHTILSSTVLFSTLFSHIFNYFCKKRCQALLQYKTTCML
jgi:hypothetical protein